MCHIYQYLLIITLDYYIAKVEPYMFKHNKHEEEQKKKQTKTKNKKKIHLINDKEEKNERSGMRWSERAEKKTKEEKQSVLEE